MQQTQIQMLRLRRLKIHLIRGITMDIQIIDIQNFRDVDNKKFIPKEVAIVTINASIIELMISFCLFNDNLKNQDEKITGFHEIMISCDSMVKPISNISHYMKLLAKHAIFIVEGKKKIYYLRHLYYKNEYNLERIFSSFKNLPETKEYRQR